MVFQDWNYQNFYLQLKQKKNVKEDTLSSLPERHIEVAIIFINKLVNFRI